jgi:hypothetical protein
MKMHGLTNPKFKRVYTLFSNAPPPPHNKMKHTKFSKNKINICIKICPFGLLWTLFLPPVYKWLLRHETSWFYETRSLKPDQIVSVLLDIAVFSYDTEHNTPSYMQLHTLSHAHFNNYTTNNIVLRNFSLFSSTPLAFPTAMSSNDVHLFYLIG